MGNTNVAAPITGTLTRRRGGFLLLQSVGRPMAQRCRREMHRSTSCQAPERFPRVWPQLFRRKFRHPLHLRSIIVTLVRVSARPPRDDDENPSWRLVGDYQSIAYARLAVFLGNIQDSGLLFGRADMLKLRCDGMDDKEWEVTARGDTIRTANLWAKYG